MAMKQLVPPIAVGVLIFVGVVLSGQLMGHVPGYVPTFLPYDDAGYYAFAGAFVAKYGYCDAPKSLTTRTLVCLAIALVAAGMVFGVGQLVDISKLHITAYPRAETAAFFMTAGMLVTGIIFGRKSDQA